MWVSSRSAPRPLAPHRVCSPHARPPGVTLPLPLCRAAPPRHPAAGGLRHLPVTSGTKAARSRARRRWYSTCSRRPRRPCRSRRRSRALSSEPRHPTASPCATTSDSSLRGPLVMRVGDNRLNRRMPLTGLLQLLREIRAEPVLQVLQLADKALHRGRLLVRVRKVFRESMTLMAGHPLLAYAAGEYWSRRDSSAPLVPPPRTYPSLPLRTGTDRVTLAHTASKDRAHCIA